jgi:hypothetical protein
MKALLAAESVFPVWFVHIDFPTTPSYSWTGIGTTSQLSQTWYGVGEHGIVSGIQSSREIRAHDIQLAIVGVPSNLVSPSILQKTRSEIYQGRAVNIYLSVADMDTTIPSITPELIWSGFADAMTFRYGKTISIGLSAEHLSSHLSRINGLRMTTENHNQRLSNPSPRDLFFSCMSRLAGKPRPLIGS